MLCASSMLPVNCTKCLTHGQVSLIQRSGMGQGQIIVASSCSLLIFLSFSTKIVRLLTFVSRDTCFSNGKVRVKLPYDGDIMTRNTLASSSNKKIANLHDDSFEPTMTMETFCTSSFPRSTFSVAIESRRGRRQRGSSRTS